MKIDIDKFLNILFAILKIDELNSISVVDVIEIINIIYSSEDFEILMAQLDIEEFNEDIICNNKYTKEYDEDGIITFEMNSEEQKNIIEENKIVAAYLRQAINKRAMAKYFEHKSDGLIKFKYDSPNGNYNLPYVNQLDDRCVSVLFSDGNYTKNMLINGEEGESYTRNIKLKDATYSIMITLVDNIVDSFDVRALFHADYNFVYDEAMKIYRGHIESYDEIIKDEPKVYKFKIH